MKAQRDYLLSLPWPKPESDGVWDQSPGAPAELTIVLGSPDDPSALGGPVGAAWLHPELDIALLEAAWLAAGDVGVDPVLPNREPLDESWPRTPVELAGYGFSETADAGTLAFAVEPVVRLEPNHIVVDGKGRTGACVGDSGGPLLARGDDGRVRVLGVLDDGSPTCTGEDFYTRTDRLTGWEHFTRLVGADEPIREPRCEGLSTLGTCLRGRAMWCDAEQILVDECATTGRICGWESAVTGFRCVSEDQDACRGVGSFRQCAGNDLVFCDSGAVRSQPCDTCGGSCTQWVDGRGAGCHSEI